ncbi:MAG: type II toxin-antitoxin system RelE family toxin [Desulfobaccales bacterium]
MIYALEFGSQAKKALKGLDKTTARRLAQRLEELSRAPFDPRLSKPVIMSPGRRSSRVGEWRIIYRVNEEGQVLYVAAICPRGKAYSSLPKE